MSDGQDPGFEPIPPPPPSPSGEPDVVTVFADPPPAPPRASWFGRAVALGAAALLIGCGGYFAIQAGSDDSGADTPLGAMEGAFAALSQEDLVGAAEFVEPSERDTMIDAGFEFIDELIRLDVLAGDFDVSSVDGFDLEFDDMEFRIIEVRDDLAHVYVAGGSATAAVVGSEIPLGELMTDRVDAETLVIRESETTEIEPSDFPVVAVKRDGRWYLSLWYSVAENARLAVDAPLPDPADRLVAIGSDSPDGVVESFVEALQRGDMATMVGLLDPEEAAALYDYAPLFIEDGQDFVDDALQSIRSEGWSWDVTNFETESTRDGRLASVVVTAFALEASDPDGSLDIDYTPGAMTIRFEGGDVRVEIEVEGQCFSMGIDEGYGPETENFCADELLGQGGLSSLGSLYTDPTALPGIIVREVGGRWYISPLRTGSESMLSAVQVLEADQLADIVDEVIAFAGDLFASGLDPFDTGFGSVDDFGFDSGGSDSGTDDAFTIDDDFFTTTTTQPPLGFDNVDLMPADIEIDVAYDLIGPYRSDPWFSWLNFAEEREYDRGVLAYVALPDGEFVDAMVLTGLGFADDAAFQEWTGANSLNIDGDLVYVRGDTDWGTQFLAAQRDGRVAVVGVYEDVTPAAVQALRILLAG
jgi:hypothetical protein